MKKTYLFLSSLCCIASSAVQAFTVYNAPFSFERRYNANSFIFNSKKYYRTYTPRKQSLGNAATKKLKKKKFRRAID